MRAAAVVEPETTRTQPQRIPLTAKQAQWRSVGGWWKMAKTTAVRMTAAGDPEVRAISGSRQPRKKDSSTTGPRVAARAKSFQAVGGVDAMLVDRTTRITTPAHSMPPSGTASR
jgi:hypothetical protein